ncbi:hypothetical protein ABIE52_001359 [Rhodococcus sp. OAS809]|uniref:Uncharacterized protein n=1 Tax=Rhodococcus erythropolis TaxID=1833 RepID=A0A6G9CUQ9_RHOER|nr:hypothetical protein G9444_3380 [Rhodococcus erythropolis]
MRVTEDQARHQGVRAYLQRGSAYLEEGRVLGDELADAGDDFDRDVPAAGQPLQSCEIDRQQNPAVG